jgi:hypothetical protein
VWWEWSECPCLGAELLTDVPDSDVEQELLIHHPRPAAVIAALLAAGARARTSAARHARAGPGSPLGVEQHVMRRGRNDGVSDQAGGQEILNSGPRGCTAVRATAEPWAL